MRTPLAPLTRRVTRVSSSRAAVFRRSLEARERVKRGGGGDLERVWANLLSRRNNETFPLETLNDFRVTRRRITRTGIVGDQTGIVSVEIG